MGSRRVREVAFFVVGVTTPLGILVVNGSAFVMRHLTEFRFGIAACALVSSLLLNSLSAWWVLGQASRTAPDLYSEYRRWAIALAGLVVLGTSAGAAYFTFVGMRDPNHLPDAISVITAVLALAVPFSVAYMVRRLASRRRRSPIPLQTAEARPGIRRRGGA